LLIPRIQLEPVANYIYVVAVRSFDRENLFPLHAVEVPAESLVELSGSVVAGYHPQSGLFESA
jgi:hypothetical protein